MRDGDGLELLPADPEIQAIVTLSRCMRSLKLSVCYPLSAIRLNSALFEGRKCILFRVGTPLPSTVLEHNRHWMDIW